MGTFGFDTMGRFALSIPTSFVQLVLILLAVWLRPGNETAEEQPHGKIRPPAGHGCSACISRWSG